MERELGGREKGWDKGGWSWERWRLSVLDTSLDG